MAAKNIAKSARLRLTGKRCLPLPVFLAHPKPRKMTAKASRRSIMRDYQSTTPQVTLLGKFTSYFASQTRAVLSPEVVTMCVPPGLKAALMTER